MFVGHSGSNSSAFCVCRIKGAGLSHTPRRCACIKKEAVLLVRRSIISTQHWKNWRQSWNNDYCDLKKTSVITRCHYLLMHLSMSMPYILNCTNFCWHVTFCHPTVAEPGGKKVMVTWSDKNISQKDFMFHDPSSTGSFWFNKFKGIYSPEES